MVVAKSLDNMSDAELRKWADAYNVHGVKSHDEIVKALEPFADGILDSCRHLCPPNLPLSRPKFTLSDIIKAIPKHCFERSLVRSLSHLLLDLVMIAAIFYAGTFIPTDSHPILSYALLWPIYWYAQGSVMTGVWVLAHECGHESFSDYDSVNNFVGTLCHSLLLVPFHSWRITHRRHHSNTGSCENDEVFAPPCREEMRESLRDTPLSIALATLIMFTVGWIPGYLVFNSTGPGKYHGKNASHFSADAEFFKDEDEEGKSGVRWSIFFWWCALGFLSFCAYTYGVGNFLRFYFVPYMITNFHLVLITYLQHTDVFMPHFRGDEWDWLRGALCTVDRSFGWVLDRAFHHITDTHVAHHLFSKMPFYHCKEATEAIKKVVGPYYLRDETPIAHAFFRSYWACQFVESDEKIVFYKNKF